MEIKMNVELFNEKIEERIKDVETTLYQKLQMSCSFINSGVALDGLVEQIVKLENKRQKLKDARELVKSLTTEDNDMRMDVMLKYI